MLQREDEPILLALRHGSETRSASLRSAVQLQRDGAGDREAFVRRLPHGDRGFQDEVIANSSGT